VVQFRRERLVSPEEFRLKTAIREGNIQSDRDCIEKVLTAYLTPLANRARFDWLYKSNPHGQVRVWLALDGNDEVIGTAAAFPRRVYIAGKEKTGWVFGDFCVTDKHRSLGPAVALQRALLQAADSAAVSVCYDFPSKAMAAVYKRLNIEPASQMVRMAKMLRVDRKVSEKLRSRRLAKVASSVGNIFLRVKRSRPRVDPSIKISLLECKCGPEFDALANRVTTSFGVCVHRSADYLNWRYLENPYKKHLFMTAKRDGTLLGFIIFSQRGSDGEIVDFLWENDDAVIRELLSEVVELFRRRGVITISAELIACHPWSGFFNKFGFRPREHKPLMVYAPIEASSLPVPNRQSNHSSWFITGGDRDS
jgi:GNAT superfamily N-acetyltransferase